MYSFQAKSRGGTGACSTGPRRHCKRGWLPAHVSRRAVRSTGRAYRPPGAGAMISLAASAGWSSTGSRFCSDRSPLPHPIQTLLDAVAAMPLPQEACRPFHGRGMVAVAVAGRAAQVVSEDMGRGSIATGRQNHQLNGLEGVNFLAQDIFALWGRITAVARTTWALPIRSATARAASPFPGTMRATRRLPHLVAPGVGALLCLKASELGLALIQGWGQDPAPALAFERQLPNPVAFTDIHDTRSLKALVFTSTP